jgi:HAD superfamily hydrolase (TIGR01662 family)
MHVVKGLIFDLGNTLMYMNGDWEEIVRRGARDMAQFLLGEGLDMDEARVVDDFISLRRSLRDRARQEQLEYPAEYALRALLGQAGYQDMDRDLIQRAAQALFSYEESRWQPYGQAEATLRRLSEIGYRLAVFSNATDDPLIQRLVDRGGFRQWLDMALSSAGVGIRKPDPRVFQTMLSQWGYSPSQVLMIGDMLEFDIQGAHNAGIRGILAAWDLYPDYAEGYDHVIPDARAETLSELMDIVAAFDEGPAKRDG